MIVFYLKIFDRFITIYHGWTATNEFNQPYNVHIIFSITISDPCVRDFTFLFCFPPLLITCSRLLLVSPVSRHHLSSVFCFLVLHQFLCSLFLCSPLWSWSQCSLFWISVCMSLFFGFILNLSWMTLFLPGFISHLFAILCLPTYSESYFLLAYLHSKLNLDSNV